MDETVRLGLLSVDVGIFKVELFMAMHLPCTNCQAVKGTGLADITRVPT
jgi:hypothetical protein